MKSLFVLLIGMCVLMLKSLMFSRQSQVFLSPNSHLSKSIYPRWAGVYEFCYYFSLMVSKTCEIYIYNMEKIKLCNRKLDCDKPQHLFPAKCLTGKDDSKSWNITVWHTQIFPGLFKARKKKPSIFDWLASIRPVHCVINAYLDE